MSISCTKKEKVSGRKNFEVKKKMTFHAVIVVFFHTI